MPIRTPALAATAALLGAAAAARANFDIYYLADDNWGVAVYHLPDMDQRRDEVPGNGSNYCVPTAAMNALAYSAQHGFPNVPTGVHHHTWWASPEGYGTADGLLGLMGFLMGTDPSNGTNGAGGMAGLQSFVDGDDFMVMRFTTGGESNLDVTLDQIGGWARGGALVLPCVGWYIDTPVTFRDGGHCVTLAGAWRVGSQRVIAFRDPATDENPNDLSAQASYKKSVYNCFPDSRDVFVDGGLATRIFWRVDGMFSSGKVAFLDSFYVIVPYTGYTVATDGATLLRMRPRTWTWNPSPSAEAVATAASAIRQVGIDPVTGRAHFLTDPYEIVVNDVVIQVPSALQSYDPSADAVIQHEYFNDALRLVISRLRRFYVQDGTDVRCLRYDENDVLVEEAVAPLPGPADAMCYDDLTDTLYVLSAPTNQVFRFASDLTAMPTIPIPGGVGLPGPTRSMAVSPRDGRLWVTSQGLNRLYELDVSGPAPVATQYILPTGVVAPNHLNVTDSGRIHLAAGTSPTSTTVKVLKVSGTTLQLVPDAPPFANIAAAGPLFIPHSMTNHDPATMEGPEFRNELPTDVDEGLGDCVADLGTLLLPPDGQVDVNDLLTVLGLWGTCPGGTPGCLGDITGAAGAPDGSVDVSDLLAVLATWGACPHAPPHPAAPVTTGGSRV